jgi:hypothetical protein
MMMDKTDKKGTYVTANVDVDLPDEIDKPFSTKTQNLHLNY